MPPRTPDGFPLRAGDRGPAVADLHRRLAACGLPAGSGDREPPFDAQTEDAVRQFQRSRGLRVDGIVGPQTWAALVEAGWRLGDRPLYLAAPMVRGDDVATLQRRLGGLGFDAGRVDGIFGPDTERALVDFQRNAGLVVDAICGPATVAALQRLGTRCDSPPVHTVRERESFRHGSLAGRTVVVAEPGGLGALAANLRRAIAASGAHTAVIAHADPSEQAARANAMAADVFVAVAVAEPCRVAFYRRPDWESWSGRRLAELIAAQVPEHGLDVRPEVAGMTLPALRETSMPAVLCELWPPALAVSQAPAVAAGLRAALAAWWDELAAAP